MTRHLLWTYRRKRFKLYDIRDLKTIYHPNRKLTWSKQIAVNIYKPQNRSPAHVQHLETSLPTCQLKLGHESLHSCQWEDLGGTDQISRVNRSQKQQQKTMVLRTAMLPVLVNAVIYYILLKYYICSGQLRPTYPTSYSVPAKSLPVKSRPMSCKICIYGALPHRLSVNVTASWLRTIYTMSQ